MTDMPALQRWLDAYIDAWRTYDPPKIRALFSKDALYASHPYDTQPVRGRDAIVQAWLTDPDNPADWECEYRALATTGEVGIARGWTRYRATPSRPVREYRNLFVMRFDPQGRCAEFTEWFVQPLPAASS